MKKVEEAIQPRHRDKVSISWNDFDQLVLRLTPDVNNKTVGQYIDFESFNECKGHLYETLQIKRDTLERAFSFKNHSYEHDHHKNSEPEQRIDSSSIEHRARKMSRSRTMIYLILTDFGRWSFWIGLLKLSLVPLIIIGQETFLLVMKIDSQKLPVITLTDIEETWEELSPPIAVFANSYMPDGTSTSSLLDAYLSTVNTEEEKTVNLTEIDWVPSDQEVTVK